MRLSVLSNKSSTLVMVIVWVWVIFFFFFLINPHFEPLLNEQLSLLFCSSTYRDQQFTESFGPGH